MNNLHLDNDDEWAALLMWLPSMWRTMLRETGLFVRARCIKTPEDMLRLILAYPVLKLSLPQVAEWAERMGIASMSFISLWERFQKAVPFLRWLVQELLAMNAPRSTSKCLFAIVDATIFPLHGANKTNWMVLLLWGDGRPLDIKVTKNKGKGTGESIKRLDYIPEGAVITGDRAYGTPPQVITAIQRGHNVVVRFTWNNLPLYTEREGTNRINPRQMLSALEPGDSCDFPAWVCDRQGNAVPGRCVVIRKDPEAARRGLKKSHKESTRKGHHPGPDAEFLSRFTTIFTTLTPEEADTATVLEAYRWRWQIEREFHRLKSISGIRTMDNSKDSTVEFYLLALLASWLLSQRIARDRAFFPWGYPLGGWNPSRYCQS